MIECARLSVKSKVGDHYLGFYRCGMTNPTLPSTVALDHGTGGIRPCISKDVRRVSDLAMMFGDQDAVAREIESGDKMVYQVQYHPFITPESDLALGVSRIVPGTVGDEYHMTKGHYHVKPHAAEIYHCLRGTGFLLLQERGGGFEAVPWSPGTITHFSADWAHRVVNTGDEDLVFAASYHFNGGLDYKPIVDRGFRKRVVARRGTPQLVDDPRWVGRA